MFWVVGLLEGDMFLDCIFGFGLDVIIVSMVVGEMGFVIGIEKNSFVFVLVRMGLYLWEMGIEEFQVVMRRI